MPRVLNGTALLTVWLCHLCHGLVHDGRFSAHKTRGKPMGNRTNLAMAQAKGRAAARVKADAFAVLVMPQVRDLQTGGTTTLAGLATALNTRRIPTARGGSWHPGTVRSLLARGVQA